jgi:hypothetical protein
MFGVGVGVRVGGFTASSGGGFDPDAQAFFDRVTTAGGTLTTTEKNATNQLVLDMKSAGIWSSMKAVYPMVGASAAACAQNLKSSSFTGTFLGGWTFASTGIKGNGTNAYMSTALNMLTQQPSSANIGVYVRVGHTGASAYPIAWHAVSSPTFNYLGGVRWDDSYLGTSTTLIQNSATYTGFFQRSASVGVNNRRRNNTSQGTNTASYTAANDTILLGVNDSNTSNAEFSLFCIGDYITTTQQDNFYTAVQSFQTTLSRQV